jgi:FKBP-type peptidyl-prolyl cis-trans isomerase SlyD
MLQKKDFVEIEFTARIKDGEIFDTNNKETAEQLGLKDVHPLIVCIGEGMIVKGLDSALEGKEIGKEYEIDIAPQDAFGFRDAKLVKIIPHSVFAEKNISIQPGMMFDFDGMIARISSVSGGRVLVDFNNPLAGKNLVYKFRITRKIEDSSEKLETLTQFYLGNAKFEMKDGKTIFSSNFPAQIFEAFAKKIKEIMNISVEQKKSGKDEVELKNLKISKA